MPFCLIPFLFGSGKKLYRFRILSPDICMKFANLVLLTECQFFFYLFGEITILLLNFFSILSLSHFNAVLWTICACFSKLHLCNQVNRCQTICMVQLKIVYYQRRYATAHFFVRLNEICNFFCIVVDPIFLGVHKKQ